MRGLRECQEVSEKPTCGSGHTLRLIHSSNTRNGRRAERKPICHIRHEDSRFFFFFFFPLVHTITNEAEPCQIKRLPFPEASLCCRTSQSWGLSPPAPALLWLAPLYSCCFSPEQPRTAAAGLHAPGQASVNPRSPCCCGTKHAAPRRNSRNPSNA